MQSEILIKKIASLPPDAIAEIETFIDFVVFKSEQQTKFSRHDSIAQYAAEHGGSETDLDEKLEQAGVEFLLEENNL